MDYFLYPRNDSSQFFRGLDVTYHIQGLDHVLSHSTSLSVPNEELAFHFSGAVWTVAVLYAETWSIAHSLIEVQLSDYGQARFVNMTLPANVHGRVGAEAIWIPTGARGLVLVLGGVVNPAEMYGYDLSSELEIENRETSGGFLSSLSIFDIDSRRWFTQNTSNVGPQSLYSFCSVLGVAQDSSSFNIYVYGGDDGWTLDVDATAMDTVWILSLPSFTWHKAPGESKSHGRSNHKCFTPFPDQMMVVGGWNLNVDGFCIRDGTLIDVFDMNNLSWTGTHNPVRSGAYKVPKLLTDTIGGDQEGGSTLIAENMDPELEKLFRTKYEGTIKHWYPYAPSKLERAFHQLWSTWISVFVGTLLYLAVASVALIILIVFRRRTLQRIHKSKSVHTASKKTPWIVRWMNDEPHTSLSHKLSSLHFWKFGKASKLGEGGKDEEVQSSAQPPTLALNIGEVEMVTFNESKRKTQEPVTREVQVSSSTLDLSPFHQEAMASLDRISRSDQTSINTKDSHNDTRTFRATDHLLTKSRSSSPVSPM